MKNYLLNKVTMILLFSFCLVLSASATDFSDSINEKIQEDRLEALKRVNPVRPNPDIEDPNKEPDITERLPVNINPVPILPNNPGMYQYVQTGRQFTPNRY